MARQTEKELQERLAVLRKERRDVVADLKLNQNRLDSIGEKMAIFIIDLSAEGMKKADGVAWTMAGLVMLKQTCDSEVKLSKSHLNQFDVAIRLVEQELVEAKNPPKKVA